MNKDNGIKNDIVPEDGNVPAEKTLVVYYSRMGCVRQYALDEVRALGADFLELETAVDTVGRKGFFNCMKYMSKKLEMPLFPYDTDVASYDRVIVFTPIWAGKPCVPVMEFLKKEKNNIYEADYVFVSASGRVNTEALARELDALLRLDHGSARSLKGSLLK